MPVVFLVPAILGGLLALGVPLLLHLRRRERERPMRFPSLMFLQRVTISTARRRRITDWPLLLVRALIVALAVLAFARPVVRPHPGAAAARGTRRVVLLVDRSMSMGHTAVWPAAIDSARSVIGALAPGDRVAVITFDEDATIEQPLTLDHAAALAAVNRIRPGSRATRFGSGIRAARELLLKEADVQGGEIAMVTDLQQNVTAGIVGLTLPPTVHLRAIDVGARQHGSAAVVGVDVERLPGTADAPNRLAVSAHIATRGFAAPRKVHVTLSANGRSSGSREVTLPADGSTAAAFPPVALPLGVIRLVVSIDHDSLRADDVFNVVVPAELVRRVVMVVPRDLEPDETLYLERALATGQDPAMRVERRNAAGLDAATLRDAVAVVLYDVPMPAGSSGNALAAWVHDGGGLVSVAGRRMGGRTGIGGLLPGVARGMVDRTGDHGGVLGATAPEHPIFAPLGRAGGGPLGGTRFFRYPRLVPAADAQIVARFDDGSPALVERQEGSGRVVMTATALDATSGDFPLQPAYLPFVRGMVLYAAGTAAAPLWHSAGDGWVVPPAVRNPVVKTPSGAFLRPDVGRTLNAVALDEAGFYTMYEGQASGDPLAVVAVNPPALESDLTSIKPNELLVGVGQDSVKASTLTTASLAEAERRQRIWRTLLLVAAAMLLGELVMTTRGWRGTAAKFVGTAPDGTAP
ncbi:MAG: BatA domain-containing protein [Gemmatimonadales bacterium]